MAIPSFSREEIENADPKRCWIDNKKNISDQHHIVPVEYGGPKSGLTVPLCPTCHRQVHREAVALVKGKNIGNYVNGENYPKIKQLHRANFLVQYIVRAKQRFDAIGDKKAEDAGNMTQISFTREELAMAHDVKKMLGISSLPKTAKYLFAKEWKRLKQGR